MARRGGPSGSVILAQAGDAPGGLGKRWWSGGGSKVAPRSFSDLRRGLRSERLPPRLAATTSPARAAASGDSVPCAEAGAGGKFHRCIIAPRGLQSASLLAPSAIPLLPWSAVDGASTAAARGTKNQTACRERRGRATSHSPRTPAQAGLLLSCALSRPNDPCQPVRCLQGENLCGLLLAPALRKRFPFHKGVARTGTRRKSGDSNHRLPTTRLLWTVPPRAARVGSSCSP
jgi:hypothetical protein